VQCSAREYDYSSVNVSMIIVLCNARKYDYSAVQCSARKYDYSAAHGSMIIVQYTVLAGGIKNGRLGASH
jgi:hypothetical protein